MGLNGLGQYRVLSPEVWGRLCELSAVPTVVVDANNLSVLFMNTATQVLLGPVDECCGRTLDHLGHPDDADAVLETVKCCASTEGTTRYLRHRWLRQGAAEVSTETAFVGCGEDSAGRRLVLMQMADARTNSRLSVLVRLLADNPDGRTLMDALVAGPLRGHSVRIAAVYGADHAENRMVLLGSHGMDEEGIRGWGVTPLNHTNPGGSTVLGNEMIWMSLRALVTRFPLTSGVIAGRPALENADVISLPVLSRGRPVGSLFLLAGQPFPRSWVFHDKLTGVASSLAPWIELNRQTVAGTSLDVPRSSRLMVTERERTILRLVDDGLTNVEIAGELGYSEATVRGDLARLSRMLGVRGRREIVRRAAEVDL